MASVALQLVEFSNSTSAITLHSVSSSSSCHGRPLFHCYHQVPLSRPRRFLPKACFAQPPPLLAGDRRKFLAQSLSLSLSPLIGFAGQAKSEDLLSEWERVYLPIDPGVVLLDIAFVPDEPNHGSCFSSLSFEGSCLVMLFFWMLVNYVYCRQ